jgi:hypothetical protein
LLTDFAHHRPPRAVLMLRVRLSLHRTEDAKALRDHVRSFGCRLIFPREGLQPFPPEDKERRERR